MTRGILKKGEYFDSISMMLLAKRILEIPGILDCAVVMGTEENISVLRSSGLYSREFQGAGDSDLIVSFKTGADGDPDKILSSIEDIFKEVKQPAEQRSFSPQSLEGALKILPDANLSLISVAGKYAGGLAMKSLEHGLNVMLFSDNVPLETEVELKKRAIEKNLLLMGPDCGTAIINGVPLAFANVTSRGNIGIVAASGTGLQETSCIISNSGCGISQAIGTGGRDVKKEVGGMMFIEAIKILSSDQSTEVILMISKPPDREVMYKIAREVDKINKPAVGVFLNSSEEGLEGSKILSALTLEEGALLCVSLSRREEITGVREKLAQRDSELLREAKKHSLALSDSQKYLRGLFSGGTFCDEAQLLCRNTLAEVFSNTPFGKSQKLKNSHRSEKHAFVDMGDDEFTKGRPHPMIDYSARCRRLMAEAEDPETAVILLDVVLGYGASINPTDEIIPAVEKARETAEKAGRYLPIICSVTGTDKDPQNKAAVVFALTKAGVTVKESNASASKLAISIASFKEKLK